MKRTLQSIAHSLTSKIHIVVLTSAFTAAIPAAHAQSANTATGTGALDAITTGDGNTGLGYHALGTDDTGSYNTAVGRTALFRNTEGHFNTAVGADALRSNTAGGNTATGHNALKNNTTGTQNQAFGVAAMEMNTRGNFNTASGYFCLRFNTEGRSNTAYGSGALINNTSGNGNIALGNSAGRNLTTGSGNIAIGAEGVEGESATIRIGDPEDQNRTFVAGIAGSTIATGANVIVNANGRLGVATSSARYKEKIKPMDKASEALLALKPVTFEYKAEFEGEGIRQFGLIAEEVEKVNPDLVVRNADGKVYTVRYEAVNAMLLNEFLKEHRKGEEQQKAIEEQQKAIEALTVLVKQQASQLEKVNARLETTRPAPQLAANRD